ALRRDDAEDAGEGFGPARVDAEDAGVGKTGPQDRPVRQPRQDEIVEVRGAPGDLVQSVALGRRLADHADAHGVTFASRRAASRSMARQRPAQNFSATPATTTWPSAAGSAWYGTTERCPEPIGPGTLPSVQKYCAR